MQTSLARRQRRRRNGGKRPTGGQTARTVAIALPLFLFGTLLLAGFLGFAGVVSAYSHYSAGLPEPRAIFETLEFDQQTRIYDRTGFELARLGDFKRELIEFEDLPEELVDATTAIEDKSFWENAGFDPFGIVSAALDTLGGNERGASTITQQLVRSRLLPPEAFDGSVYERKIREIIQSVRLTQAYPNEGGKQAIMAAYLNNNFYGNQSYGVRAAAMTYFDKELSELTLAESALLAGIPQAPTRYDLVKNAELVCTVEVAPDATCPPANTQLQVPDESEVVQRRDYILELMKTRSVLSGQRHSVAEYERAKNEPVILAPQLIETWRAPHFVWQVQRQLAEILCGTRVPEECRDISVGGYRVTTTLDWEMQKKVEKWMFISARTPGTEMFRTWLTRYKIPESDWGWLSNLAGRNIHNAAAGVQDARTGQIIAYAGSAGYFQPGNAEFQPEFDVLSDGYRQPGSAIKPIDYAIGIDERRMTASTLFMDVVTNFGTKDKPYTPKQADNLERGPVRLRSALQFSLNVPAIKAGFVNGIEHQFERSKAFGLTYLDSAIPVISESIGTLETRPIDMLGAYSTLANGGRRLEQQFILEIKDSSGKVVWPLPGSEPEQGEQVVSPEAAWIISDILRGNTDEKVNPYWAEWAVVQDGTRREAAYKTGTTEDNVDVAAYGYLAPPADPAAPQLVVGVWMGNSNNAPNSGSLSLDSSAPVWSRIMRDVSAGTPMASFDAVRPASLVQVEVDAHSGMLPGPFTNRTVNEWFIADSVPKSADSTRIAVQIDSATGLLWKEGCTGPAVTKGFLDLSTIPTDLPAWAPYTKGWMARAAGGAGRRGGPEGTATAIFYNGRFAPFGRTWGGSFAPTKVCEPLPPPPDPCLLLPTPVPAVSPDPNAPPPIPCPSVVPLPLPSASPPPG
jgi:membrane peptidoglycan carboxypeptidase